MAKKEDKAYLSLIINEMKPDRTQFKKYGLSFIAPRTMVSVPVSSQEVSIVYKKDLEGNDTDETDVVVLSLNGLMEVVGQIADSIDDLDNKHLEDLTLGKK